MHMDNYVIGVSNNVIVNPSTLGNSVSVHNPYRAIRGSVPQTILARFQRHAVSARCYACEEVSWANVAPFHHTQSGTQMIVTYPLGSRKGGTMTVGGGWAA